MEVTVHGRMLLVGVTLLTLAGCAEDPVAVPPVSPPARTARPASAAGGSCALLDFGAIEKAIGARFDVSVATKHHSTKTCVVRAEQASQPDLALSVSKTSADASIFLDSLVPSGARTFKGLGKAAYQLVVGPTKKRDARVEIVWLSADGRLISLCYTFAPKKQKSDAEALAPKLVDLAKEIDAAKAKP